uniref:Transposable element P transposase-like RNase H domain-containing protein n=1 Tax=Strigamia maritima TaxID=126957 RepID=T1IM24_STRMM
MYLREKGFPLPSKTTMVEWTRHFKCKPGILHDVLAVMNKRAEGFSELDKLCVLSFDEMNVDSRISYDQGLDQVLGPFSNVQVVMARGLVKNWKQLWHSFALIGPDGAKNAPIAKNVHWTNSDFLSTAIKAEHVQTHFLPDPKVRL